MPSRCSCADLGLLELLEDALLVLGGDPGAGVCDRDQHLAVLLRRADLHASARGRELDRVLSRLKTTWRMRRSSPSTSSTSELGSTESVTPFLTARSLTITTPRSSASRSEKGATSSSTWPASTLDRSSTSLIRASRWLAEPWMSSRYSSCLSLTSPKSFCCSTWVKPMIAFSGVRSSCYMLARNSDLWRLAASSSRYSRWSSSFMRLTLAASAPSSSRFATSTCREKSPEAILARRPPMRWIGPISAHGQDEAEQEGEHDGAGRDADEEIP